MWLAASRAVALGDLRRGADHDIAEPGLADVGGAVIGGEARDHLLRELIFAVHQYVLVGNEHVVEVHQRLLAAESGIALVDVALLQRARVAGLAAVDIGDAGSRRPAPARPPR
jgi:hypothetical protein